MSCNHIPLPPMAFKECGEPINQQPSNEAVIQYLRKKFPKDSAMMKTLMKSAAVIYSISETEDGSFDDDGKFHNRSHVGNYHCRIVYFYGDVRKSTRPAQDPIYWKPVHFNMLVGKIEFKLPLMDFFPPCIPMPTHDSSVLPSVVFSNS